MSGSESILIDHFNVKQITMNNNFNIKLKEDQTKREYWHKFIIENGAFLDEDRVLLSILNFISPLYLVPVKVSSNFYHNVDAILNDIFFSTQNWRKTVVFSEGDVVT